MHPVRLAAAILLAASVITAPALVASPLVPKTLGGPRFEVVFSKSAHDMPITGRVYVAISRTSTAESTPIQQTGQTGVPLFGVNVDELSGRTPAAIDAATFGFPVRSLSDIPATPIWGRDAALKRFELLYQGTWKLSPDMPNLKVILLSDTTAQLFVPIMFNIGPPGQPAPDAAFLMNQTLVRTAAGWRIASILPIPLPTPQGK